MWYMPAVLLTVGIAVISLWEAPQLPPPVMSLGDKVLHGLMYTALAVAWMVPVAHFRPKRWPLYIYVCLAVTAFGVLMEILQRFCTLTRSGEMADVYADFIGAFIGVLIVGLWRMFSTTSR
jgi:VanZ family protein